MKENLLTILNNTNEWLRYLEEKNALIIGFNSALIFGLIALLIEGINVNSNIDCLITLYIYNCIIFLFLSLIVSLTSLVPKKNKLSGKNIMYFSDIASMGKQEFESKIKDDDIFENDLKEQIIANSKIANQKQKYSSTSLFLLLIAFTTIIGALIIRSLNK